MVATIDEARQNLLASTALRDENRALKTKIASLDRQLERVKSENRENAARPSQFEGTRSPKSSFKREIDEPVSPRGELGTESASQRSESRRRIAELTATIESLNAELERLDRVESENRELRAIVDNMQSELVLTKLEDSRLVARVADHALHDDANQLAEEEPSPGSSGSDSNLQRLNSSPTRSSRGRSAPCKGSEDVPDEVAEPVRHKPGGRKKSSQNQDVHSKLYRAENETTVSVSRSNHESKLSATVYAAIVGENAELTDQNRQLKELVARVHEHQAGEKSPTSPRSPRRVRSKHGE
jgi:septal ring factor EnvC (AmiA/AmiB activator)